jgi:hypothetical protein
VPPELMAPEFPANFWAGWLQAEDGVGFGVVPCRGRPGLQSAAGARIAHDP